MSSQILTDLWNMILKNINICPAEFAASPGLGKWSGSKQ